MDQHCDIRRNAYKERSRFKPEEVRRRRENAQVEIRKQKKEENLAKRRNFNAQELAEDSHDDLDGASQDAQVKIFAFHTIEKPINKSYFNSSWPHYPSWFKICIPQIPPFNCKQLPNLESFYQRKRTLLLEKLFNAVLFLAL